MTTTAKLFMSGRSQAIRLPAKLRMQAQEVCVEQIGNVHSGCSLKPRPAMTWGNDCKIFLPAPMPCHLIFWQTGKTRWRKRESGLECRSMRVPLDTNICSYILRRHPVSMIERFAALERSQVWLSSIVAAELRFGAAKLASPRFSSAGETWLAGFDVRPWPWEETHH